MNARHATVLFIDDEPLVLRSIRRELAQAPFRSLFVESAAEALRIVAAERIDVVVSDVRMPEMDGVELLDRLRGLDPLVVRVILSGHADLDATMRAINAAAVYRFLTKPWPPGSLVEALRPCLTYAEVLRCNNPRVASALDGLEHQHPGITQRADGPGGVIEIPADTMNDDIGSFLQRFAHS